MTSFLLPLVAAAATIVSQDFEYIREGNPQDVVRPTQPGFALLGGGGDVTPAFSWMIQHSGGGDFLVLRATGTGAYNPFVRKQGAVNSAATLILKNREASSNPEVLDKVRKAEAIFFAGGDQWNYISRWKGTPLQKAIQDRIDAGVPVGGTSAGLAILGQYLFSAEFDTVQTPHALTDPYTKQVTVDCCFVRIPHLENLITDSHFMARKRMGRLLAFLARMQKDRSIKQARSIGIDEATAVLLNPDGSATIEGKGSAFFFRTSNRPPERCESGKPLSITNVDVYRVERTGSFDLKQWKGKGGTAAKVEVQDGTLREPFL